MSPGRVAMAVALAVIAWPSSADATNTRHVRTPVVWTDAPCMTLHDRSQGAVMHLPYDIPFEDTEVGPDEVADSRTHQFFAMCRSKPLAPALPWWITAADLDAAIAADIDLSMVGTAPSDILESASAWDGCWARINADDDRRPITTAAAMAGVDWDTSSVAAGSYVLWGYTWEPATSLWTQRPGVVKVHDGDPDGVGPAAAILLAEVSVFRDETIAISGCIDAAPGAVYSVEVAELESDAWTPVLVDQPVEATELSFEFTPPAELAGAFVGMRLRVDDPGGLAYVAYAPARIIVVDAPDPAGCADSGGGFIGAGCGSSDEGGTTSSDAASTDTSDGSSTAPAATPAGTDSGCGSCSAGDRGSTGAPALGWLAWARIRRRRRQ